MTREPGCFRQFDNMLEGDPPPVGDCGRNDIEQLGDGGWPPGGFQQILERGLILHAASNAGILQSRQAASCIANRKSACQIQGMDSVQHKIEVGRRLRTAIEALNLSQKAVCDTLGFSQSKLGNWLRGDNYPDEWVMYLFCERYNVTADWLYRGRVSVAMARPLEDALWSAEQASSEGLEGAESQAVESAQAR